MKKLLIFGIVFLMMITSVIALEINTLPEITLTYDNQNVNNVNNHDDNFYHIYCYGEESLCHIYRIDDLWTEVPV